jgi:uncharacterized phiE125 gp8 family phage protein
MDYTKTFPSFFPYFVITAPVGLPIALADVKEHLLLDPTDTLQDNNLTRMIRAAASFCESYTRRTLLITEFRTFRNLFTSTIELRRSPFKLLNSFQYSVSGSFTDVDSSLYYTTQEIDFSNILLVKDELYPIDIDEKFQSVKIEFNAGYATDSTELSTLQPQLYLAILNHIAALFENRGDCDAAPIMSSLPNASKMFYDSIRILEIV